MNLTEHVKFRLQYKFQLESTVIEYMAVNIGYTPVYKQLLIRHLPL